MKRWVTAKEATAILNANSEREDIKEDYIRQLARAGKVEVQKAAIDNHKNLYRSKDIAGMVVQKHGKGDTVAARKAGSRRKSQHVSKQVG